MKAALLSGIDSVEGFLFSACGTDRTTRHKRRQGTIGNAEHDVDVENGGQVSDHSPCDIRGRA